MRSTVLAFFAAAFLVGTVTAVQPLQLQEGRMRLTLHEESGRFSLHYLANIQQDRYVPYLFQNDPRTSALSIFADNSVYRMGDAAAFSLTTERTERGARFLWRSSLLEVEQRFRIIRSTDSELANGIEITVTVQNVSERDLNVGVAYVLDTYLGEEEDSHFLTSDGSPVAGEARFSPSSGTRYIVSPSYQRSDLGLMVMLSGNEVTAVDEAIAANWKRLSERPWSYEVNSRRDFNLLPYSINDSALALYYERKPLAQGAERSIITRMGNSSASTFAQITGERTATSNILESSEAGEGDGVYADLVRVNDILSELNTLLENPSAASDERIDVLRRALESLTEEYESE